MGARRRPPRSACRIVPAGIVAVAVLLGGAAPAAAKGKPTVVPLATAATWIDVASDAKLTPFGTPEQTTDTSAPRVQAMSALLAGLGFQGLAVQTFARTQPDSSDPSLLVGNDIFKVIVFKSAKDAKKFKDADIADVVSKGSLKKVGNYGNGAILDDSQGHINTMFTIDNVVVDLRTGVTEPTPGAGVKDITKLADIVSANAKGR